VAQIMSGNQQCIFNLQNSYTALIKNLINLSLIHEVSAHQRIQTFVGVYYKLWNEHRQFTKWIRTMGITFFSRYRFSFHQQVPSSSALWTSLLDYRLACHRLISHDYYITSNWYQVTKMRSNYQNTNYRGIAHISSNW
jgi:hypothetical protein